MNTLIVIAVGSVFLCHRLAMGFTAPLRAMAIRPHRRSNEHRHTPMKRQATIVDPGFSYYVGGVEYDVPFIKMPKWYILCCVY
jgi:hypothetical protein